MPRHTVSAFASGGVPQTLDLASVERLVAVEVAHRPRLGDDLVVLLERPRCGRAKGLWSEVRTQPEVHNLRAATKPR